MRILGKIYHHAHKPECAEIWTTCIFIAWMLLFLEQRLQADPFFDVFKAVSSLPLLTSTFPNFLISNC